MPYSKTLEIVCPENYGNAIITVEIMEHINSNNVIDKKVVTQNDCDLQFELLTQNNKCDWSCLKTREYIFFKENIEK